MMVLGSVNMDITLFVHRAPVPGECLTAQKVSRQIGGKGLNQAVAARRYGADITYVGKVGMDAAAQEVRHILNMEHIDPILFESQTEPTGSAYIILESTGQNRIIVHGGANLDFTGDDIAGLEKRIAGFDLILMQLETNPEVVEAVIAFGKKRDIPVIIDAGPAKAGLLPIFKGVDVLSPNETELALLMGTDHIRPENRVEACREILRCGVKAVLLKIGSEGSIWVTGNEAIEYPAYQVPQVVDTTGAGDAFTAAFASAVLEGNNTDASIRLATAAGALAVTKAGALPSMPYRKEIQTLQQDR